jgi:hypothetical protein
MVDDLLDGLEWQQLGVGVQALGVEAVLRPTRLPVWGGVGGGYMGTQ